MRDAEAHIDLASNQLFRTATLDAALKETRAYAAFLRSDFSVADELLRAIQRQDTVPTWYHLKAGLTHIRLLLRGAQWEEAENEAARYLNKAIEARVAPMIAEFELARAEALLRSGKSVTGKDLPLNQVTDSAPLSVRAALYTVLANAASLHQQKRSSAWKGRAYRLFLSTGNQAAVTEAGYSGFNSEQFTSISTALPAPDLDSAVALLELAGYPHILGREALAVIRGAACVEAVALIATASAGARVVDLDGWDERQALAAAAKPAEGIEVLPVGRHRDEAWQIVARPRTAVDPYCTFAAIRKLLATAVALDQYRRDEKQRAALWPPEALDGDSEAIWASEQMAETLAIARRIAPTTLSVLVTGETGTGKEMLARAIHRASDRADRAFLPFNCAAVPRDMLESQLFGHRKGAFTGADSAFPGVIRSAAGGTLFLDEIGEIGPDVQPKLLRFLETREIHPLGEPQPLTVDVRVIAATNAGLEELVAGGRFREDLFYRLNVVRLKLPPLRERREEIPPLVHHYLRRFGDEHRKGRLTLSDETLEYLLLYSWPGNVRQLANEVRRMVALAEPDATLTPALLSPEIQASRRTVPAAPGVEPEARLSLDQPLPAAVQTLEQMMVRRALDRTHGRVEEASRLLGISRKGLFLKRRRWGLQQAS
jgi:DNA-binding NtrC family response regulator